MAFKLKLSDELQAKIDAEAREIGRIYALPDRWLAAELIRLTRLVRSRTPYAARRPENDTYNSTLLWDVIPEVARRLGAPIELNESADANIRRSEGEVFREFVAACVTNASIGYLKDAERGELLDPVAILFHSFHNGNPIAVALDRIVPPTPESQDAFSRGVREVSHARGHGELCAWEPRLQEQSEARNALGF